MRKKLVLIAALLKGRPHPISRREMKELEEWIVDIMQRRLERNVAMYLYVNKDVRAALPGDRERDRLTMHIVAKVLGRASRKARHSKRQPATPTQ